MAFDRRQARTGEPVPANWTEGLQPDELFAQLEASISHANRTATDGPELSRPPSSSEEPSPVHTPVQGRVTRGPVLPASRPAFPRVTGEPPQSRNPGRPTTKIDPMAAAAADSTEPTTSNQLGPAELRMLPQATQSTTTRPVQVDRSEAGASRRGVYEEPTPSFDTQNSGVPAPSSHRPTSLGRALPAHPATSSSSRRVVATSRQASGQTIPSGAPGPASQSVDRSTDAGSERAGGHGPNGPPMTMSPRTGINRYSADPVRSVDRQTAGTSAPTANSGVASASSRRLRLDLLDELERKGKLCDFD